MSQFSRDAEGVQSSVLIPAGQGVDSGSRMAAPLANQGNGITRDCCAALGAYAGDEPVSPPADPDP